MSGQFQSELPIFKTNRNLHYILYIKWAVKNGIKEAYRDITGKVTTEDIEAEQICNEEGNYSVGLRTCCADRKNT